MKNLSITILIMVLLMAFSLTIDLFQGFDTQQAVHNGVSPFQVMHIAEIAVLVLFLVILLGESLVSFYHNRKR